MTNRVTPMRVGYVIKMFPRLSETFILNEMLQLEAQGVELVVFSIKKPNEGKFHPQLSALKAPVFYLEDFDSKKWANWLSREWSTLGPLAGNLWPLVGEALAQGEVGLVEKIWFSAWVAAQAVKLNLDRLHAHFASLPSTIAYLAHKIAGIPYSLTAHAKDIFVYDLNEHHLRDKLLTASPFVTVTNYNYRYLTDLVPESAERIEVLHNGINLDLFQADDSQPRETNLILAVGRLVVKKGFGDLLSACRLLKDRKIPFTCLIVGDGPEATVLKEQQESLGLQQKVTFAGGKTVDEVQVLMRKATLFCLPCTVAEDGNLDALPTVLLESLASGLPTISTPVSGIPEIIDDGQDGLLVPPDDPEALAQGLTQLLQSEAMRQRFALAGRAKAADKFDLRRNVATLQNIFCRWNDREPGQMQSPAAPVPKEDSRAG